MFYKDLEFFNVAELEKTDFSTGMSLQRFPKAVRDSLGDKEFLKGRIVARQSTGSEIRFVTDGNAIRIYLSTLDAEGDAYVYKGSFFHSRHCIKPGVVTQIQLEEPPAFTTVVPEKLEENSFSTNVWRILFNRYCAVFHGIDALGYNVRPPQKCEVPKLRWLAYGSSITHGSSANSCENSYIQQAAKRLKIDTMCWGLGGACHCEKEVADHIAVQGEWDIVTLELGVNMFAKFSTEEFENRVEYMINTIQQKNPCKPVVLITTFPNYTDYMMDDRCLAATKIKEFNNILRKMYLKINSPSLHIIEGQEVLPDFCGLACDLLHPSSYGHILMGEKLAEKLRPIIEKLGC